MRMMSEAHPAAQRAPARPQRTMEDGQHGRTDAKSAVSAARAVRWGMPGLYPPHQPRDDNPGEVLVWTAFSQATLGNWSVFHSLKLRTVHKQFGEGDFIVCAPDYGALIVEVKGGEVTHAAGHWFQSGRPMSESPLTQAHRYRSKLKKCLAAAGHEDVPLGVACWLSETPAGADGKPGQRITHEDLKEVVLFEDDLSAPRVAIERCLNATLTRGNGPPTTAWIEAIARMWGEDFEPRRSPRSLLDRAKARVSNFDDQQLEVLNGLDVNPRMVIQGGAGTGKTTVALEVLQRWAWEGTPTRYLCFTEGLARWIDASLEPLRAAGNDVRAVPLRARARELSEVWGLSTGPLDTGEDWTRMLHMVRDEARRRTLDPLESVVIDEAQNFDALDWEVALALTDGARRRWVFHDPRQSFWDDRPLPEVFAPGGTFMHYTLRRQQRASAGLSALAQAYLDARPVSGPEDPRVVALRDACDPDATRCVSVESAVSLVSALGEELDRLLALGIAPSDVMVVTLLGQYTSDVHGVEMLGAHEVTTVDDPRAEDHVVLDTFLRVQGLDRPFVIVCEVDHPRAAKHYERRMHMALTRAIAGAIVVRGASVTSNGEDWRLQVVAAFGDEA